MNHENVIRPLDTKNVQRRPLDVVGRSLREVLKSTKKGPQEVSRDGTVRGGQNGRFGPAPNPYWFPIQKWSIWSRFGLRQARGRSGPFSDRPERGPRDDRNGGPGRESKETIRVSKSMMMSTMTSSTTTTTTTMPPTTSRSRQKIRGVQKSK